VYLLARQRGIGRAATERLLDVSSKAGAKGVRAITHPDNTGARRLLEGLGFELIGPATCEWAREDAAEGWLEYQAGPSRGRGFK